MSITDSKLQTIIGGENNNGLYGKSNEYVQFHRCKS